MIRTIILILIITSILIITIICNYGKCAFRLTRAFRYDSMMSYFNGESIMDISIETLALGDPVVVKRSGEVGVVVDVTEAATLVVEFSATDAGIFHPDELRAYNGYGATLFVM